MPNPDAQIDEQMAADSAEYDQPAQTAPPKKPSILSSAREKFNQIAASSKAKFEQHQREEAVKHEQYKAERAEIKTAEKEAALKGEKERRVKNAYEREVTRRPFLQNAMAATQRIGGAVKRFGGAANTLTSRLQASGQQKTRPQMFGGMGSGQPDYSMMGGSTTGAVPLMGPVGGGVSLFGSRSSPSRHTARGTKRQVSSIPPLIAPVTGRNNRRGSASAPSPFMGFGGMGKVGKMPPLFGPMKKGKRKQGYF